MTQESRLVIVIDSKNAERNARNLGNELDSIERNGDYATKSMDKLSVATRQLAGYMAGVVTVGAAINKMDLYTGIINKLKLVTNSQEELNRAMTDTFDIAQRSASSWSAVNDVYSKYMSNAKTLNLTQAQTAKLTEITSKAVAISGSNAESAAAALFQYGQALDGGMLRAEEFNSLVDGAGGLLNAMAKGLGVTRGELRQMMLDGKLTGEVITKALLQAGDSVEELFNKTDKTVGQSLEMLSNGIAKFVGEAGKGSGAAQTLSGSIQSLANNLDLLVNGAVVAGIGLITKAVLTKTVAIQASVVASAQQRAANLAEAQSQVQLLGVEAMRARQSAALVLTEIGLARAEYNAATTANARAIAVQRRTAAEIAHSLALKEATAATMAYTVAQGNLNRVATLGSRALGLVGGPIGAITLGITALAAGYMYFQDKAAQANKKLEEQASVAKKAKEELLALRGLEKDSAINDMTTSFERQNKALAESSSKINIQLNAIAQLYKGNKEVVQVVNDARDGTISMNEAVKRFNELRINKYIYESVKANTAEFVKNATEATNSKNKLNLFGIEVELAGRKAQTAKAGIDQSTESLDKNASAAERAKKKLEDLQKTYAQKNLDTDFSLINIKSHGLEMGKALSEFYDNNKIPKTRSLTKDEWTIFQKNFDKVQELKKLEEDIAESKRQQTKEMEKQQKVLTVNAKVKANAAKYDFAGIEAKNNLPAGTLSAIHMIESRGNARAYNQKTGATGGFQFLEGTAKQYGVKDRYDLGQSAEGAGKYMSYLLKLFKGDLEKAIRAYHAGEGNVQKGKGIGKYNNQYWKDYQGYMAGINGYTAGDISSKDFDKMLDDSAKMAEEQAKLRLQLENDVANEVTKIRNELSKKLEDVDKANFNPARKDEIKAELKARADNDIAIAQQALKTKLDDYKQFNLTEKDLIKESFARRQFEAEHDFQLTKDQRKEAVNLLGQQLQQELGLLKLAQEQRLFQARIFLLSETAAMQERYRLERLEIEKTVKDEEERRKRIALSKSQERLEVLDKATTASQNWDRTYADMTGNSQQYQLNQTRADQTAQSYKLASGQEAVLIMQAQDPNANLKEIAAQREQIWAEHTERMKLIESTYQNDSISLQLGYGANVTSALAGMFKNMLGESSSAYRILYESQRAFALAQAGMNMWKAASDAYANEPGTWYQKAAAAAIATIKSGTFVSLIQAATPQGFADGGYTGNGLKHTPAGIVHKGEVVWSQEDIKRWGGVSVVESMRQSKPSGYANGGYVSNNNTDVIATRREALQFDAINSGRVEKSQPTVTIINQTSEKVDATSEWDGKELTVILKEYQKQNEAMVDSKIEKRFMMSKRQGW